MFRIGEFSKLGKTTIKTLRHYDEIGLLKPEYKDPFTSYRMYTSNQLVKLHTIQSFRQLNLSLDEIKDILEGQDVRSIFERRKEEILAELENKKDQLSRIEFILSEKKEEQIMNYQATVKQVPEHIVYSKKMTVPNYNAYFELIPKIGEQVTNKYPDLKCAKPEYCFISYLDGEYKEKDINIEFCEAVEEMYEDFDDIVFKKQDATTVVSVMHEGPYSTISGAYAFAFKWIEENGYKAVDNPRENYIDGIWNKENESEWLTELQIPISK